MEKREREPFDRRAASPLNIPTASTGAVYGTGTGGVVMELMTCHWDGYCIGRNNFRIYHDMDTGKMVFLPHGMDQMFADANYAIQPSTCNGLVAQAVIRTPEGRQRYRERHPALSR